MRKNVRLDAARRDVRASPRPVQAVEPIAVAARVVERAILDSDDPHAERVQPRAAEVVCPPRAVLRLADVDRTGSNRDHPTNPERELLAAEAQRRVLRDGNVEEQLLDVERVLVDAGSRVGVGPHAVSRLNGREDTEPVSPPHVAVQPAPQQPVVEPVGALETPRGIFYGLEPCPGLAAESQDGTTVCERDGLDAVEPVGLFGAPKQPPPVLVLTRHPVLAEHGLGWQRSPLVAGRRLLVGDRKGRR